MGRMLKLTDQGEVRFMEALSNGVNYVALAAPTTLAGNFTLVLPAADGSAGQVLATDGSGGLTFTSGVGTLQSAYDNGKTITIGATPIGLTITGNQAGITLAHAGTGGGKCLTITSAGTDESIRINHSGDGTAFALEMTGNSSAALIHHTRNQACLVLHAEGNSAALQISQDNLLDSITTNGDIRCQQTIATVSASIRNNGIVAFSESGSLTVYRQALILDNTDALTLGNSARSWPTHLVTGNALLDVTVNARTLLSFATSGVVTFAHSVNQDLVVITKSGTGSGTAFTVTNHGTAPGISVVCDGGGRGISVTQSGAENAILISHSGAATALDVSSSDNTNRAARFNKTGTGGNPAVDITNAGTGNGVLITQNGDGVGFRINSASGSVNPCILLSHAATGDVNDILGTSSNWHITSKGNFCSGRLAMARSNRTISSGAITISKGGLLVVDTEAAGATDDLDTIASDSTDPVVDGQIVIIIAAADSRTVVVRNNGGGTGNIFLNAAGNRTLDSDKDTLILMYDLNNARWLEVGFSSNGT